MRHTFMRFSFLISLLAFFVVAGNVLFDQWVDGHASAVFMLGTAAVIAGACMAVFAIIAGIGLAVSAAFGGATRAARLEIPPVPHNPSNSAVDKYRSANDGSTTTMFLSAMPARPPISSAAATAAPDEMPPGMPS
jgi:hypothetical protein